MQGSNSKLLSKEFATELSGRYVSFRIRPFVYKEIVEYSNIVSQKSAKAGARFVETPVTIKVVSSYWGWPDQLPGHQY